MVKRASVLSRSLGYIDTWSFEKVIHSYTGTKRKRYQRAFEDLGRGKKATPKVTMFVKQENIAFSPSKVNPACRAIQFRDYKFALELARYIKPIEKRMCGYIDAQGFPKTRFIAKGLNSIARAKLHLQKAVAIPGCFMIELDAHRFDAHVSREALGVEFGFYKSLITCKRFKKLLKQMVKNKGYANTAQGVVKYLIDGGRMSGDMSTGLGNCILMSLMLSCFGLAFCGRFDFLCDGDDSIFYSDILISEDQIKTFFLQFGFDMKVDNVTQNVHQVGFCQCKVVLLDDGPRFIRDPLRSMSRSLVNPKFADIKLRPKLVKTIAMGELCLNRGCPILDSYFRMLIRSADAVMSVRGVKDGGILKDYLYEYRWLNENIQFNLKIIPITANARSTFYTAFNYTPSSQVRLEEYFDRIQIDILADFLQGDPLDVSSWIYDWRLSEKM